MRRFSQKKLWGMSIVIACAMFSQVCPVHSVSPDALAPQTALQSEAFKREGRMVFFAKEAARQICRDFERLKGRPLDHQPIDLMMPLLIRYGVYSERNIRDLSALCAKKYFTYADTGAYTPEEKEEIWRVFNFLILIGVSPEEINGLLPQAYEGLKLREAVEDSFLQARKRNFEGGYLWKQSAYKKAKLYADSNAFLSFLDLKPGETYIDVLGGAGEEAIAIAQKYPASHVIMIDANAMNMQAAVKKAAAADVRNIRFQFGDVRPARGGIRVPSHSVHAVSFMGWALAGYGHDQLVRIFEEVLRVLAPGGRIFFDTEILSNEGGALYAAALEHDISFKPDLHINQMKDTNYYQLDWFGARIVGKEDLAALSAVRHADAVKTLGERILGAVTPEKGAESSGSAFCGNLFDLAQLTGWRDDPVYILEALYVLCLQGDITLASTDDKLWIERYPPQLEAEFKNVTSRVDAIDADENNPKPALPFIKSHEIKEFWRLRKDSSPTQIEASVVFYSGGRPIGEGWIDIDKTAVSLHSCRLKSHVEGQLLGTEIAARLYRRAAEISRLMGFATPTAHVYYTLSHNEEREVEYLSDAYWRYMNEERPEVRIFNRLGFRKIPLKGKMHLNGIYGDRYNDRTMPLGKLLNLLDRHWVEWFYAERARKVGGDAFWQSLQREMKVSDVDAEKARHDEAAFLDVVRQLGKIAGFDSGMLYEKAVEMYPKSSALRFMLMADRIETRSFIASALAGRSVPAAARREITPVDARRIFLKGQTIQFMAEVFSTYYSMFEPSLVRITSSEVKNKLRELINRPHVLYAALHNKADTIFNKTYYIETSHGDFIDTSGVYGSDLIGELGVESINQEKSEQLVRFYQLIASTYLQMKDTIDQLTAVKDLIVAGNIRVALNDDKKKKMIARLESALARVRAYYDKWNAMLPAEVELALRDARVFPVQKGDLEEMTQPAEPGRPREGGQSVAAMELIGTSS